MTTGLEKRRQKKPVAGHDGPGNMDRRAAARIKTAGKGQAHAGMTATQGLPKGSAVFLLAPGGKFFQTLFPGTRGRTTGHSAATAILEDPAHDEEHDDDADDGEQRSRHMTSRA